MRRRGRLAVGETRGSEGSSGRLKQEAPEEEYAQDNGKRDDDDLDESQSHSRFLRIVRLPLVQERHFIGAFGGVSTFVRFIKTVRKIPSSEFQVSSSKFQDKIQS